MRMLAATGLAVLIAATRFGGALSAQDIQAMSRWASAQVIHYHVSGDYSGTVPVIKGKKASNLSAKISDHVEFDFDWDNLQQKIAGVPAIKNFPSKVAMDMADWSACPAPKVTGTYEYWTLETVVAQGPMFQLSGKMSTPAGTLPLPDPQEVKPCGAVGWETIAASTPQTTARMQLAMGMMLVMPATPGYEMEITPDKRSFIQKINTDGWVWTQTPVIVK